MADKRNPYEVLGLDKEKTSALEGKPLKKVVLKAYKNLLASSHSDHQEGEEKDNIHAELNEARDVLLNPEKKKIFDKQGFEGLQKKIDKGETDYTSSTEAQDLNDLAKQFGVEIETDPDDLFGNILDTPKREAPATGTTPRRGRRSIKDVKNDSAVEQLEQAEAKAAAQRAAVQDRINEQQEKKKPKPAMVHAKTRDIVDRRPAPTPDVESRVQETTPESKHVDLSALIENAESAIEEIRREASSITTKEGMENASYDIEDLGDSIQDVAKKLRKQARRL